MKKILSKIFKMPAVIFSAGIIAAFALFAFFHPQKPAVEIVGANSTKPTVKESHAEIGIVPEQESVFLASGSYFNSNAEWSTWFIPPSSQLFGAEHREQRYTIDLNGDGLLDYVIIGRDSTSKSGTKYFQDRVYLNNGNAWNIVYSCDTSYSPRAIYNGDCATTDSNLDHPTNYGCFSDYQSWPHSGTYSGSGSWNWQMPVTFDDTVLNQDLELLTDINGDGLPDYVWVDQLYDQPYGFRRCVYLNNGHGWDLAYRCVQQSGILYGDCAQPPYYGS